MSKTRSLEHSVLQIEFSVDVAGEAVPCVLWKPSTSLEARILLALGHGGSQPKQTPGIRDRAIRYALSALQYRCASPFSWTTRYAAGGVFGPIHDHEDRPGMVYILQGTITDHRNGVATKLTGRRTGGAARWLYEMADGSLTIATRRSG